MKRPKKALVKAEMVPSYIYSVDCPHCHTNLRGLSTGNRTVTQMNCWQCKNPINLTYPEVNDGPCKKAC